MDKWGLAAGVTELSAQLMEKTNAGPILCLISEEKGGYWSQQDLGVNSGSALSYLCGDLKSPKFTKPQFSCL